MEKTKLREYICDRFRDEKCLASVNKFVDMLVKNQRPLAHHLLLCIAIDLKFNLLTTKEYGKVFNELTLNERDNIFTKFNDAVMKFNSLGKYLFSRHGSTLDEKDFKYITIMKTHRMKAMIPDLREGTQPKRKRRKSVTSYSLVEAKYKCDIIKKGNNGIFWLGHFKWVEGLIKTNAKEYCKNLIDLLGLHHYNEKNLELSYLEIPSNSIETFQPNTTQAGWDTNTGHVPFMSYCHEDGWGRTFPISGVISYRAKGRERIVPKIPIVGEEQRIQFKVVHMKKVEGKTNYNNHMELIAEGIKRFSR